MKKHKYIYLLVLAALLLFAFGCEKGGHVKIFNQTSHAVYLGALGSTYTLAGNSALNLKVDTPTSSIFTSDAGKFVELAIVGETYQIWDDYLEEFVETTNVWVETGKTTKVYLNPNRACIKVNNNSTWYIKKIIVQRNTNFTTVTNTYDLSSNLLGPGENWFKQQTPADSTYHYYYLTQITFENDQTLTYGDEQNILYADDQFVIDVPVQEKQKQRP